MRAKKAYKGGKARNKKEKIYGTTGAGVYTHETGKNGFNFYDPRQGSVPGNKIHKPSK